MNTYLVRFTLSDSTNGYAIVTAKSVKDAQRIVINYGDNANLVYNIYSIEEFQLGLTDRCCNPNTVLASGITTKGEDGKDGVGIKSMYGHQTSTTNYELTVRLTNGTIQTFNIELVDPSEEVNQNRQRIILLETRVNNLNGTNIPIDSSNGAQSITQTIINNKQVIDAAIEELNQRILNLDTSIYIIAPELPSSNIQYQKIYIVPVGPGGDTEPNNIYAEWVRIPGNPDRWEKLGEFKADVDLSNYWSKDEITINTTNELLVINDGNTQWVAHIEELVQPEPVIVSPTSIITEGGQVKFDLETETEGASIIYTIKQGNTTISEGGSADNYIENVGFDVNVNSSGFDSNGNKNYTVIATSKKNGLTNTTTETITVQRRLTASATVSGNEYNTSRNVTITSPTSGVTIYYTTDGSTPTTNSTVYSGPVTLNDTATVKAIAVKSGWANSEVVSTSVTVGTLKMYYTLVQTAPTTTSQIEAFTAVEKKALPVTIGPYTSSFGNNGYGKVCFAYANPNRDLTSIKDNNGFEYIEDFVKTTVGSYRVYTMKDVADQKTMKYTFN